MTPPPKVTLYRDELGHWVLELGPNWPLWIAERRWNVPHGAWGARVSICGPAAEALDAAAATASETPCFVAPLRYLRRLRPPRFVLRGEGPVDVVDTSTGVAVRTGLPDEDARRECRALNARAEVTERPRWESAPDPSVRPKHSGC